MDTLRHEDESTTFFWVTTSSRRGMLVHVGPYQVELGGGQINPIEWTYRYDVVYDERTYTTLLSEVDVIALKLAGVEGLEIKPGHPLPEKVVEHLTTEW